MRISITKLFWVSTNFNSLSAMSLLACNDWSFLYRSRSQIVCVFVCMYYILMYHGTYHRAKS